MGLKRPKKVQKAEKSYLPNEQYQDFAEQQFNNIYDYLNNVIRKNYSNTSMKAGNMQFYKIGRMVFFQSYGDAINLPTGVNKYISQLDEEFRPLAEARFSPINTNSYYMMIIKQNSVELNNYTNQPVTSATNCAFCGCYISAI